MPPVWSSVFRGIDPIIERERLEEDPLFDAGGWVSGDVLLRSAPWFLVAGAIVMSSHWAPFGIVSLIAAVLLDYLRRRRISETVNGLRHPRRPSEMFGVDRYDSRTLVALWEAGVTGSRIALLLYRESERRRGALLAVLVAGAMATLVAPGALPFLPLYAAAIPMVWFGAHQTPFPRIIETRSAEAPTGCSMAKRRRRPLGARFATFPFIGIPEVDFPAFLHVFVSLCIAGALQTIVDGIRPHMVSWGTFALAAFAVSAAFAYMTTNASRELLDFILRKQDERFDALMRHEQMKDPDWER
ncbi:MAG: hypothetical protein SF028_11200 [Candidatus Sumerlaeia bacterium]|nr:hypothetical protein [Candidatus Sumerlaeia bacterium]